MSQQNDLAHVKDMLQQGQITLPEANVKMIRLEGVRLIRGPIPAQVRKALTQAVKAGELGHIRKDGVRPEAYYHPNARSKALHQRDQAYAAAMEAIRYICA